MTACRWMRAHVCGPTRRRRLVQSGHRAMLASPVRVALGRVESTGCHSRPCSSRSQQGDGFPAGAGLAGRGPAHRRSITAPSSRALAEPRGEPVDLPGPAPRVSDIHRIRSPVGSPQSAEGGRVIPRRCHRAPPRAPSAEQGGGRVDEFRVGGLGAVGSDAGTEERRSFDQHGENVRPCLANSVGE